MTMAAKNLENSSDISPQTIKDSGLTIEEYDLLNAQLGRTPNPLELAITGAMWSEHCSYKSSKKWLKTLPTEAPHVIQGPGENAGVIDIGDGQAAIFKIESHNSPSFIEPFQGAATGVGGILRDVFTMGARPVANLNALRFGEPENKLTRHLLSGAVAGIGSYGNCVGVPTVGGEVNFHKAYNGNCLVNCMTVGIADTDKIFYAKAAGVGNPIVYVGSKTGRDGIGGATMSSEGFEDDADAKRPTVQVGDPFTEKLLIEACLELMAEDAIIAIQDMGAAGLTSSTVEMASKGEVGVEIDLDKIPAREENMQPHEFMLSESQERMLMVLKPGSENKARAIFEKWELDFSIIEMVTDTKNLTLTWRGETVADMPVDVIVDNAPEYDRDWVAPKPQTTIKAEDIPEPSDYADTLVKLMSCPDMASKRWIYEQYDSTVMADTFAGPGKAAAAIVRVHGTQKALAMTTDCTPRYCYADPFQGGAQAVAETYRNISATGAKPLAITNNLNFGNPERPEIMGQFVGCVGGMRNACEELEYPVISGNVSLYNETSGKGILPAPVIGGVGVMQDITKAMTLNFKAAEDTIVLIGETAGWMGSSLYLREIEGQEKGAPPPVDLATEKRHADFIRLSIEEELLTAAHDVSDGGLLCAVADMALAGNIGADLQIESNIPLHTFLFGEDQARFVVTTQNTDALLEAAAQAGVPATVIGKTNASGTLTVGTDLATDLAALRTAHEGWLPNYMEN